MQDEKQLTFDPNSSHIIFSYSLLQLYFKFDQNPEAINKICGDISLLTSSIPILFNAIKIASSNARMYQ